MSYENRRSIIDILKLNPNIPEQLNVLQTEYRSVNLPYVKINGNTYTNYGAYSFIWEKSYVESPERSIDGSMGDLANLPTFLVGHFIIDFSLISIDDYRSIMRQHYEQNEFIVECYDVIYNKPITLKMYFATEEMAKLYIINKKIQNKEEWEDWLLVVGVQDYKLEMIGTNNSLSKASITYHLNPPTDTGIADQQIGGESIAKGTDFIVGRNTTYDYLNETFEGRYKFKNWSTTANQDEVDKSLNYMNNYAYTLNSDLVLYAQWQKMESNTLSFSYGVAYDVIKENTPNEYFLNKTVVYNQEVGTLPQIPQMPEIETEINGEKIKGNPYSNGGWYKLPEKVENSDNYKINKNTKYWTTIDNTAFLLYDIASYRIAYYIDGVYYSRVDGVQYNTTIPLLNPQELIDEGYTFDGWYYNADYTGKKVSGNMPPFSLSLYGRWEK